MCIFTREYDVRELISAPRPSSPIRSPWAQKPSFVYFLFPLQFLAYLRSVRRKSLPAD